MHINGHFLAIKEEWSFINSKAQCTILLSNNNNHLFHRYGSIININIVNNNKISK